MDTWDQPISEHLSPQEIEALIVALHTRWWRLGGLLKHGIVDHGQNLGVQDRQIDVKILPEYLRAGTTTVGDLCYVVCGTEEIIGPILDRIPNPPPIDDTDDTASAEAAAP